VREKTCAFCVERLTLAWYKGKRGWVSKMGGLRQGECCVAEIRSRRAEGKKGGMGLRKLSPKKTMKGGPAGRTWGRGRKLKCRYGGRTKRALGSGKAISVDLRKRRSEGENHNGTRTSVAAEKKEPVGFALLDECLEKVGPAGLGRSSGRVSIDGWGTRDRKEMFLTDEGGAQISYKTTKKGRKEKKEEKERSHLYTEPGHVMSTRLNKGKALERGRTC